MSKFVVALFCVISGYSTTVAAYSYPFNADFNLLPPGTNVSLVAQYTTDGNKKLFSHQSKQLRIPASTQKIITALAALLELGREFRFTTSFMTHNKIKSGKLLGDLILVMTGDPTFTLPSLQKMIATLKKRGLHRIDGNIIINTSIFTGHDKAPGWSWNNLSQCYNTAPSAAIIDGNCFYVSLSPAKKIGGTATVSLHSYFPVNVQSQVMTTSTQSNNQYCELDIVTKDSNKYLLKGCMKITDRKKYLHFAITDSDQYVVDVLREQFSKQHITHNGDIILSQKPVSGKTIILSSHQSRPLWMLLTDMLKKSNNLIADVIFRTIGAHHFNIPGTWHNSSDALRNILKNKANIDLKNSVIVDGSGLSRLNLLSANTMLKILKYIAQNEPDLKMMRMFPIAGIDGTLRYRNSLRHFPFRANVMAKTGYLEGSYNLAGFIKTKSNRYIAFVQFLSGYTEKKETKKMKKAAIMLFEKAFYAKYFSYFNKIYSK